MVVAESESEAARLLAAEKPATVQEWDMTDLADLVIPKATEKVVMRGMAAFMKANCNQCHVLAGHGVNLGPDLSKVAERYKNTRLLQQLIEQLETRRELGIIPPKFVFPRVIESIDNILSGAPFDNTSDASEPSTILADFSSKVTALDLPQQQQNQLMADASSALVNDMAPAYLRLRNYMIELQTDADDRDGAWKFPDGEAFYNYALQRTTTTNMSADEIHRVGLAEVARIQNEMREIMQQVGFDGDLQAFFNFTRNDPQFYYPDTAEGKQAYLDEATALINTMKSRLDELFNIKPNADLMVKAVEPFREASAGQAFYQSPAPDGSRRAPTLPISIAWAIWPNTKWKRLPTTRVFPVTICRSPSPKSCRICLNLDCLAAIPCSAKAGDSTLS